MAGTIAQPQPRSQVIRSALLVYIGDAVAQELPLVSFSPDGGEHDWSWLLDRYHLLSYDLRIAAQVRMEGPPLQM